VDCELLERLVSSFSHTFKDTNKKEIIYAIIEIRVSQRDRWIALGFELSIPVNGARKRGLSTEQNHVEVHRKRTCDLVPFSPRRVLPSQSKDRKQTPRILL
jgi:hypothetical protein